MERKENFVKLNRSDGSGDTSGDKSALQVEKRPPKNLGH